MVFHVPLKTYEKIDDGTSNTLLNIYNIFKIIYYNLTNTYSIVV